MTVDIFDFWAEAGPNDRIHPKDRDVLSRVNHRFTLDCFPAPFLGPLRTAPLVLLYLAPGLSDQDAALARRPGESERYLECLKGRQPLPSPSEHGPAWAWWSSRTRLFGHWEDLREKVAILEIGCYHSKTFADEPLLAALPSSRATLDWAQWTLFPQAIAGERVVICMRSARFWGLDKAPVHGRSLYAPAVTRGGHMIKEGSIRGDVIKAARAALATE